MRTEKRNHPRVEVSHPVLYFSEIHTSPSLTTTTDIGLGGARIETPYNFMIGQAIELAIAINPQVIHCRGQVVHVLLDGERPMAGIRFEGMSQQDKVHLQEHIYSVMEQQALEASLSLE